ncbi:MAG: Sec-independent protein translocase protein TatB [Alphaproteobacteria bacterium]|nr:Sec-independent protein translocase protein TatB [Alphaproteobacteria bacterium]
MMPGVGFAEMILLALVAIVVIGPRDLPLMMRKFGRFTGKMRSLAFEFRQGIDELGRQAELDELRKEVLDLKKHTGIEDFTKELEQDRIDMEKDIASAMSPAEIKPAAPAPAALIPPVLGVAAPGAEPPLPVLPAPSPVSAATSDAPPSETPAPSAIEALAARQASAAGRPRALKVDSPA